jgi:hypothetical protein
MTGPARKEAGWKREVSQYGDQSMTTWAPPGKKISGRQAPGWPTIRCFVRTRTLFMHYGSKLLFFICYCSDQVIGKTPDCSLCLYSRKAEYAPISVTGIIEPFRTGLPPWKRRDRKKKTWLL